MTKSIIYLSLLLSSSIVLAQNWEEGSESRIQQERLETYSRDNTNPLGWWPFGSINLGLLNFDDSNKEGDGQNLQVKGLLSFYDLSGDYVFEGGVGIQNSNASDKVTTSALLEAGSRLRWSSRWEAGPILNMFIGQGDRYGSSNSDITSYVGGNLLYRIPLERNDILRVGGRWVTDIGIPNDFSNIFMFEVHYGLPFQSGNRTASRRPSSQHLADRAFEDAELNSAPLPYSTRQVEPNSTTKRKLATLAQELLKNEGLVDRIRIVGHADQRGSAYSNQMLSKARAQEVANALIFSGFPKERIEVVAMGENRPIAYSESAFDRNRRVEIEFRGVSDSAELHRLLEQSGIDRL